jgi:hypothetical protein
MKRNHVAVVLLFLIVSLNAVSIHQASAPPLSAGYTCGLVSVLDMDIRLTYATVNISITPDIADGENLTHDIEVSSNYNITNMADHEVSFLTSYVRSAWMPLDFYSSVPKNVTIEGNSSMYNASIAYNITSREELPVEIRSRYPTGFFSSYFDSQIDLIDLTMAAQAELVLLVETKLSANCWGNYFDFRYGLDMQKLMTDSTQLEGRLDVSNTSLLVRTDLLNSHSRSVNHVGDSLVTMWSISDWEWGSETTYPGQQLDDDVFSDYLGVQLWQSEYFPPTPDGDGLGSGNLLLLLTIPVIVLVVLLVVRSRWDK